MTLQLEASIAQILGAKRHIPRRAYGQPGNSAEVKNNLTLSSLIMQDRQCRAESLFRTQSKYQPQARGGEGSSEAPRRGAHHADRGAACPK